MDDKIDNSCSFTDNEGQASNLRFVVDTVDVNMLGGVDVVQQQFAGKFTIGLKIKGGAKDEDMCKQEDWKSVRKDSGGTLHPSARWYLSKLVRTNVCTPVHDTSLVCLEPKLIRVMVR